MKKEIRIVDEKKGLAQITTSDERFYCKQIVDPKTGLPVIEWKPSITFIASSYPKSLGYMKWLAAQGWDEAESIKVEAGDRGTVIHHAIARLLQTGSFKMDDKVPDRDGALRELTADEYYAVMTFLQWYGAEGCPAIMKFDGSPVIERTVEGEFYAGTLDMLFENGLLVDIKSGKGIYPSHHLQLTALRHACEREGLAVKKAAILQVGYTLNKTKHYKLTEIEDCWDLWKATYEIWKNEHGTEKPLQREFPLVLELPKKEAKVETD